MRLFVIFSILLGASLGQASLTVRAENASATYTPTGMSTTYYYSNISSNEAADTNYYLQSNGSACSTDRNPNCRNTSDAFRVYATPSTSGGNLILIARAAGVSNGSNLTHGQISTTGSFTAGQEKLLTTTFGAVCTAAATSVTNPSTVTTSCLTAVSNESTTISVSVVQDKNSNGIYDSGTDELAYFNLVIKSYVIKLSNTQIGTQIGLYDFSANAGNTQVRFRDILTDAFFPDNTGNGDGVSYVRFYYYKGTTTYDSSGFDSVVANGTNSNYYQRSATVIGDVDNNILNGLENGYYYYFKSALVDRAGNIGYVSANVADKKETHAAKPEATQPLFKETEVCAVGSIMANSHLEPHIKTLRQFRDQFLVKSPLGKKFVFYYYKYSPHITKTLTQTPWLKEVLRTAMYPVVGLAWLCNQCGPSITFLIAMILIALPFLILNRAIRKASS